ncbi:TonB-dependent receptor domain-containing protein [Pseudohalioglobus lutimaris]|uniref:TonB-dependent receptor n=1 Tax=Pseudohalioglobus lutimaris TaxID=1737061 RepID=A0A2N5X5A4_9GAMM|nr:TonB-dependent receptor [Pseudohalioglobus lutimaris]PLW69666.1 TonB-dependent receptor [Pseudohalioglobus lutimaris]
MIKRKILPAMISLYSLSLAGGAVAQEGVLEEVIVTGVLKATSKLESTASVTALTAEEVLEAAPRSTAEVFRALPGIHAESSSGDANANIKVRGMPISSGGSRYVSIQEDGFPMLLVGDASFATADSWLRMDTTVGSVQSIRGGTAATTAWNAPGGVINFISKTGEQEGGSIGVTSGLDYDSVRLDANYGGTLAGDWTYHVGGFYRDGEGVREEGIEEGYQIKATVARDFDRGSVKVHFKHLDDEVPTYLPIPAIAKGSGSFREAGVDFSDGTLFLDTVDCAPRQGNKIDCVGGDSFQAEMTSIAFDGTFDFNETFSANIKYRTAAIEGNFASPFPAAVYDDGEAGPSVEIVYFNTKSNDEDNDFSDINLSADFDSIQARIGVAFASQNLATTWNFNQYYRRLDGNLTTFDQGDSVDGVLYSNPAFGNCCSREYDFEIDGTAPYIAVTGQIGNNLSWDASYRDNRYDVDGTFAESPVVTPLDVNRDGVIGQNEQEVPTIGDSRNADYDIDYDAWSVGVNYAIGENMAVFGNISEGGSLSSPDRVTGSIQEDGDMFNDSGFSEVEQAEIGFKYEGDNASFYVTYFTAETTEAREFEVTTQNFIENTYDASGIEVEGSYDMGNGFGIRANATFTDSEIKKTGDGVNEGNKPRRQADYLFNITPYYIAENWDAGVSIFGTDEVYVQDNNDLKFDGYITTSVFFNYMFNDNISLALNVNNLFDEEGFTEGEEGSAAPGDYVRIRPINGRTTSLTLKYDF